METWFSTFKENFEFFNTFRYRSNEYYIKGRKLGNKEKKIFTQRLHTFYSEGLVKENIELGGDYCRSIIKREAVDRFHPNKINNKEFWAECRKSFPLLAVCGAPSKNIKEVNKQTLQMSTDIGLFPFLMETLLAPVENQNLLEIGYGYGNVFLQAKDMCNYYGIDYIKPYLLKKYENLYEIDESGIPDILMKPNFFDVVYCVNVLQHCSQQDRFTYFKQASEVLKPGGHFLFTEFLMTPENKNTPYWGVVDEKGRGYTHFFNQLTECDWDYELTYVMNVLGFKAIKSEIKGNAVAMIVQKQ